MKNMIFDGCVKFLNKYKTAKGVSDLNGLKISQTMQAIHGLVDFVKLTTL